MAKILIVDDAAFMRMRLSKLLVENGHEVIEAENGKIGVEKYEKEKPDVVFMDITMPEMDGLEAVKEITKKDPKATIIMCSALGQQNIVMNAIKLGAKDFIVKPYNPERILAALGRFVK